jgi:hypothetical protein
LTINRDIIGQALRLLQHPEEASRNKSLDSFSPTAGQKALRLYRLIKSLEKEFKASKGSGFFEVGACGEEDTVEVRFINPALRYTRICYLPRELFAWLSERLPDLGQAPETPPG